MQETSEKYKRIFNDPTHKTQVFLEIGYGVITNNDLISLKTSQHLFDGNDIKVGRCISSQIDCTFIKPDFELITNTNLINLRINIANRTETSELLNMGEYYIDTYEEEPSELYTLVHITGYDEMITTEQNYPESSIEWPATDIQVLEEIHDKCRIWFNSESEALINKGYMINYPAGYSVREVLSYIAAMYGGWWIVDGSGRFKLIQLGGIPKETNLLTDEDFNRLIIGGDRIIV